MKNKNQYQQHNELKIERLFGKLPVAIALVAIEDAILFFAISYLTNVAFNILPFNKIKDLSKCFDVHNFLPKINRIGNHYKVYLFVLLGYIVLCLMLNIRQIYRMRTAFSNKGFNMNQRGSARWTTGEEIKQQYTKIPDRDKSFPGYGGTIISRMGNNLYIDQTLTNNLIIGITRSGKGEMFVIPSIDIYSRAEQKTSMAIIDPKTELYKTSKKTLEKRGYDVRLLSLVDPIHSMGFNPLKQIVELYQEGSYDEAELLTQTFCYSIFNPDKPASGDSFWQDSPSTLLSALILAHVDDCIAQNREDNEERHRLWNIKVSNFKKLTGEKKDQAIRRFKNFAEKNPKEDYAVCNDVDVIPDSEEFREIDLHIKKINMYSIINLFGELVTKEDPFNPEETLLDKYFNARPPLDRAKLKYFGIQVAGSRTRASIYTSMLVKLTIFTYEGFAKMTAESSLNLEDIGFGERPMAVFIEIPDYDKSSHFLGTVFLRQLYFVLAKRATREKDGKCKNRVKIIADEFGNIPPIEAMENIMTVCLGRNISFDLYIQAYSQLTKLYGENAKTITGNCGNTIYILSDDDETTEKFSKNIGYETIIDLQRSGNRLSSKKTFSESMIEKPLINMNQLEELRPGECIIKRVMKRTDNKGHVITPHPIFNSIDNGRQLLFRYEYLIKSFPNPTDIDLHQVNTEDRSYINLEERVWSYQLSVANINFKERDSSYSTHIFDIENKDMVIEAIKDKLNLDIDVNMIIDDVVELIEKAEIEEETKNSLVSLLGVNV